MIIQTTCKCVASMSLSYFTKQRKYINKSNVHPRRSEFIVKARDSNDVIHVYVALI